MAIFNDLQKSSRLKLQVVAEKSKENQFVVRTDDNEEFHLPKMKFQKESQIIPEWLDVYVRDYVGGYPQLRQDISALIPRFYKEGNEYEFKVRARRPGTKLIYDVEDDNGLFFQLPNAPSTLQPGRRVKCKVLKIKGSYVQLYYTGQQTRHMRLTYRPAEEWIQLVGSPMPAPLVMKMMRRSQDFKEVMQSHNKQNADWIISALTLFWQNVTKYLVETSANTRMSKRLTGLLNLCVLIGKYIIEGSDYLKDLSLEQRSELQDRISGYIETFSQIQHAAALIEQHQEESFIDNILANLKQAGYLYHPGKQFRIMMAILRLRPELISDNKATGQTSRITQLFEALHSWNLINWKEEPFRSALVDQLQIFISENSELADNMTYGANGDDNRQLNRVIRALAIQSLLAKSSDNVDLAINKARLYRFLSYFHNDDIDQLLYKSVAAILGNEFPHDFSWDDTSRIQVLQEKASFNSNSESGMRTASKVFSVGKLSVELSPRELVIRTKFADNESSVLPNGTISWMSPKIYLRDRVKTPSPSKKNDLGSYRQMWADIENSIFADQDIKTQKPTTRKVFPEDGDEVAIIIDDLNADYKNKLLRFHCTIVDDYYKGSGWLNAVPADFLPWLDFDDYPSNYDHDLSIFQDSMGRYLKFPAKVMNSGAATGDNIRFTMKKMIDEYVTELPVTGELSHAIVRNVFRSNDPRYYDHYLCLSDRGYSVKVPIKADETDLLQRGTHVTVRYLELEQRSSASQSVFMKGEIVEVTGNPSNYGKKTPLKNLFQGMGEPDEEYEKEIDSLEVEEAQNVMSREDMHQLILMVQRRAYAEKEYVQAFNLLSLGATLARAIEDNYLYEEMRLHQELLTLLQYYARNRRIDDLELEKHKDAVKGHAMLQKLYTKLEIVSSKARPETNPHLWELAAGGDETEKRLASLVLSYNLLPEEGMESSRKELSNEISAMLNVNTAEAQIKYYGEEDQHVEFKSSLIFTNKQKDRMQPRPEEQMHEILEIIAGFLNSQGGTLYIGVNDLGYEAGLHEDLSYRRWKGLKATIDAEILTLEGAIHDKFPENVWNLVSASPDPESAKGVICVEIQASKEPVFLDGMIWVRNSSSTRPRTGSDLDSFLEHRSENYDKWLAMRLRGDSMNASAGDKSAAGKKEETSAAPEKAGTPEKGPAAGPKPAEVALEPRKEKTFTSFNQLREIQNPKDEPEEKADGKAAVGRHRTNVLHEYEGGFVHPAYYLNFLDNFTYYLEKEDTWAETAEDNVATLAVKDEERQGWIVASFADGSVARTAVAELEQPERQKARYANASRLTYIDIASDLKDYLLTYLRQPNGMYYVRVDRIVDLAESHQLKSAGKRLSDHDYQIVRQEILTEDQVKAFYEKAFEMSGRLIGASIKIRLGSTPEQTIEDDLKKIFPA